MNGRVNLHNGLNKLLFTSSYFNSHNGSNYNFSSLLPKKRNKLSLIHILALLNNIPICLKHTQLWQKHKSICPLGILVWQKDILISLFHKMICPNHILICQIHIPEWQIHILLYKNLTPEWVDFTLTRLIKKPNCQWLI